MIIHTGFELAANRRNSSSVAGRVCALRAFRRPRPPIRHLNPPQEGKQQLKQPARTLIQGFYEITYYVPEMNRTIQDP
jgi:hypothetical protein